MQEEQTPRMAEPMEPNDTTRYPVGDWRAGQSPQRDIEAIRAWLRSGGHNDLDTLATTARRLIENGLLATRWMGIP
jgi:hypothetical protein